jgi:selenocysteine lyase/cysteine desulfurase
MSGIAADFAKADAMRVQFDLPAGMTYLDTSAHAPMLRSVLAAGQAVLARSGTPWSGTDADWNAGVERVRAMAAQWLDGDVEGVAFVPSAAYGVAVAARNLPLARGDAVLVLDGQFPSNLLAWQQRCAETGARIVVARREPGQDWTAAVLATLERNIDVRIATLPQAHWHDGAMLDLDRIAPHVRARGAALMLDLSQSLGALAVDVAHWQPDFVVSVGYKWLLGVTGLSLLWAAPHWREHGVSIEQHWSARNEHAVWRFDPQTPPEYRPGARRFDAGGVIELQRLKMLEAALSQLQAWGAQAVLAHLRATTDALDAALDDVGLSSWNTAQHAPHFTGLRPPRNRFAAAVAALREANIVCTARHGVLRIAPHLHVDPTDMQRVARKLASAGN